MGDETSIFRSHLIGFPRLIAKSNVFFSCLDGNKEITFIIFMWSAFLLNIYVPFAIHAHTSPFYFHPQEFLPSDFDILASNSRTELYSQPPGCSSDFRQTCGNYWARIISSDIRKRLQCVILSRFLKFLDSITINIPIRAGWLVSHSIHRSQSSI